MTTSPLPQSTAPKRKKIVVLGGALDPITFGHCVLAEAVSATNLFDEVWFMPCFEHPFGKQMAHWEHRLEMCRIAASNIPRCVASNWEIFIEHRGTTFESMTALRQARPELDIHIGIGTDNVDVVYEKWTYSEEVRTAFPFVIVPRGGFPKPKSEWYRQSHHLYLKDVLPVQCASSSFKKLYEANDPDFKNLLIPEVLDYVLAKGLYAK